MQADSTLDRSRGGLGLGLALVKGLVELHGGSVEATSTGPQQGSTFVLRLPLDKGEPAEATRPCEALSPARRVLLIEDNLDAAESLRRDLELHGHEVAVAHHGADGVAMAREQRPEIVICDLGLPVMDGYAVAQAIRADALLRDTRLIALSGYALPDALRRAAEAGFETHIAKPATMDQLQSVLRGGRRDS